MGDAEDSALYCLTCEYNLTGINSDRCPECGADIDWSELRAIAAGETRPIWDWTGNLLRDLPRLWCSVAFTPELVARDFPPHHNVAEARAYSWGCYIVAALLFLTGGLIASIKDGDMGILGLCIMIAITTSISFWVCETLVALVLASLLKPLHARYRLHFWRGLMHCTSGFTILTGAWAAAMLFILTTPEITDVRAMSALPLFAAIAIICAAPAFLFGWWVYVVERLIVACAAPGPARGLASVAVPVIGMLCICLGIGLSGAFAPVFLF